MTKLTRSDFSPTGFRLLITSKTKDLIGYVIYLYWDVETSNDSVRRVG